MSKGIVCFANNNGTVDYLKQAILLAKRVKKFLNLPTTIITSSSDELETNYSRQLKVFDKIISVDDRNDNRKRYYNGSTNYQNLYFKNFGRVNVYDLTPYDTTLVLDTDYIICNDILKNAFDIDTNFQIYKEGVDLAPWRELPEFQYINNKGIPFYWATCFCFTKTTETKIFFDLLKHIVNQWEHYQTVYDLGSRNFRNDHAFSIAIHIMNGYQDGDWAKPLPGKMFYTLDKDILHTMTDEKLIFLLQKQDIIDEYTFASTQNCNVHVMNKFSLENKIEL